MRLGILFFSFDGRINRAKYWLAAAIWLLTFFGFFLAVGFFGAALGIEPSFAGIVLLLVLIYIPIIWSSIAVGIKRLHDRNKSGWWLLVFYLLPFVISVIAGMFSAAMELEDAQSDYLIMLSSLPISAWALVELGILRGTVGPNPYGEDPLGPRGALQPAD